MSKERNDILYLVLVRSAKFTLLPELYEIFGDEYIYKFLEIFEGTTIEIPSINELQKAQRDIDIYMRLNAARGKEPKKLVVQELASFHDMEDRDVRIVYKTVRNLVRDLEEARGVLKYVATNKL